MKTYSIGELLAALDNIDDIGYCYKGDFEGRLILCDVKNDNRIFWLDEDGRGGYDFYLALKDISKEESRHFVLYRDLDEFPEMKAKIIKSLANALKVNFMDENE